jgi:hypothetical protein
MATNSAFLEQQWRKRHHWTVEECLTVNVYDLARPDVEQAVRERASVPLPQLELTTVRCGAVWRAFIVCPRCESAVQFLFLPPPTSCQRCEASRDWACRGCHGLVYASQRYARRHPLRQLAGPPRFRLKRILEPPQLPVRAVRLAGRRCLVLKPLPLYERNAYGIAVRRVA